MVTIIGLVHGEHALGFMPVNGADNNLHLLLSAAGIVSAPLTRRRHDADPTVGTGRHASAAHGRREERFDRETASSAGGAARRPREGTARKRR